MVYSVTIRRSNGDERTYGCVGSNDREALYCAGKLVKEKVGERDFDAGVSVTKGGKKIVPTITVVTVLSMLQATVERCHDKSLQDRKNMLSMRIDRYRIKLGASLFADAPRSIASIRWLAMRIAEDEALLAKLAEPLGVSTNTAFDPDSRDEILA